MKRDELLAGVAILTSLKQMDATSLHYSIEGMSDEATIASLSQMAKLLLTLLAKETKMTEDEVLQKLGSTAMGLSE